MQILATPLLEDLFQEMWWGSEDLFEDVEGV